MTAWLLRALCGLLTGILSAWGIGGGTLLLLCMTLFFGVEQRTAQAINLLYFLPTAGMSLFFFCTRERRSFLKSRQKANKKRRETSRRFLLFR